MNNENKIYEGAKIEILALSDEDVICSSNSINLPDVDVSEIGG